MQCHDALELFSDYVTGQMERALQVAFEAHLQQCRACREGMQSFRVVWEELNQLPRVEAPASLHERILAQVEREQNRPTALAVGKGGRFSWQLLWRPQVLAAAALVVIVILAGLQFSPVRQAALGLPDKLFGWLHPTPKTSGVPLPHVTWQPNASQPGGQLVVHIQFPASLSTPIHYWVTLVHRRPGLPLSQGDKVARQEGIGTPGSSQELTFSLSETPAPSEYAVLWEVAYDNHKPVSYQQLPLPTPSQP